MRTYLALSDALPCALLYSPVSPALFCLLSCVLLGFPVLTWALLGFPGLSWALPCG